MSQKEFSCIKQVVKTIQIPLPATFISNETSGIAEILESWKRQYVKQLQGVVVNYKRYSLSSQTGFISPNKPFIYYNVRATFDLFCPKIGDIVKGRINRISKEHVGCLIEDTINVTIYLSKNIPGEVLQFINLNRDILFEISYFNYDRKIIRVTGVITPKCIQLMNDLFPPEKFSNIVDTPELSYTDEGIGTSSESTDDGLLNQTLDNMQISNDQVIFKKPLSSSKKSKRDSESSFVNASEVSSSDEMPKKKKKRKDKSVVSEMLPFENVSNIGHTEENSPNSDLTIAKKHKKKRKLESSPSIISGETSKSNIEVQNGNESSSVIDVAAVTDDLVNSTANKATKLSKKHKRDSQSCVDSSDLSTADEMPKKKTKLKNKADSLSEKEKNHLFDSSIDEWAAVNLQTLKKDISSSLETVENVDSSNKKKKKGKSKKSKEKDKSKKKKGKVLASGAVRKKDKRSDKKRSKKNKLDDERAKKHKKSKSHKKDSNKKKKKDGLKSKSSNVTNSGND